MRKSTSNKVLSAVLLAATSVTMLAGCGGAATPSTSADTTQSSQAEASVAETATAEATTAEAVEISGYSEAPMLAEQVTAGTLPAVEERIPNADNIFVETADATGAKIEIGNYGGVINLAGAGGGWGLSRPTLESIIRLCYNG